MKKAFSYTKKPTNKAIFILFLAFFALVLFAGVSFAVLELQKQFGSLSAQLQQTTIEKTDLANQLEQTKSEIEKLKSEDQRVRNNELLATIKEIEASFKRATALYERILDLRDKNAGVEKTETLLADALSLLNRQDYKKAKETLDTLEAEIKSVEQALIAKAQVAVPAATASNTPPSNGYSRQKVSTSIGEYVVSLVAGDLGSTRVVVDTATNGNCGTDCPVLSLGDYVSRSGGYAGVNGTYFCPATYPSCAEKKNSFDLLVMNKEKTYINSDNNVYSNNPAVIFGSGYVRFVSAASQWGRDTGVDGVLSNYPLLLSGGEIRFSGGDDPKQGSKGNRSFVASKGNVIYIGVVHGATVAEAAVALKGLGMENALNLDNGGSTALWSGGYKVGPGRALPNAIVFVRK